MSIINLPGQGLGWDYRQCPNAPIPGALGGYEYSGNQYLFLLQGSEFSVGDLSVHALKSTNLGATWTDTGSVYVPNNVGTGQTVAAYTSCMDGTTVYVMGIDLVGAGETTAQPNTGPLLLYKYNLLTSSFGAGSTPSGAPTVSKGWNGVSYPPRSGVCLHLLRRGTGDMLLLYTSAETVGANKYSRISIAAFNGTSFGSGVMLGGQAGASVPYIERCAGMDVSGNLHVIFVNPVVDHLFHVGMNPAGSFGTMQTVETDFYSFTDTSNLLDFPAPADTIAFLAVRNASSSGANGDLAIYVAAGGSLNPTWTFHNLPSTANVVQDPVIAPDWIGALGFLDGTLRAFWTQTGVSPSWSVSGKQGQIHSSTAAATDLTTWAAETTVMGPFDSGTAHWGAGQVAVWAGSSIGLGVLGNFEGYDSGGTGNPIEMSKLLVYPPAATPPAVTCGSPPNGKVGVVYSHTFPASAGTPPYTFTITTGTLPPGLLLTGSSGGISGTPTLAGNYPITVTVTDAASATGTANCSLHIDLDLQCNNPPNGTVGASYLHAIAIHGATPPNTFSITSGGLPPGLSIDTMGGVIVGVPTIAGTYSFQVSVTDSGGNTAHVSCSISIGIAIDCNNPPGGILGNPYSHPLTISGAPVGSTVGITVGALPTGLTIDNTGLISGTPAFAGGYGFTVTVTPTSGTVGPASVACTITIVSAGGGGGGGGLIDIVCGNPPGGKVGVPYNHTFPVIGATGPTVYSIVVGALPPGVHLDPATGDLSGTPTAPGTYSFSVKVQQ